VEAVAVDANLSTTTLGGAARRSVQVVNTFTNAVPALANKARGSSSTTDTPTDVAMLRLAIKLARKLVPSHPRSYSTEGVDRHVDVTHDSSSECRATASRLPLKARGEASALPAAN